MTYRVKKGTTGKYIELNPNQDAIIKDWIVRKDCEFPNCLIDPVVVKTMVEEAQKCVAGVLANQGYALFGGDSGNDRRARYVLAVKYGDVEIIS